MNKLKAGDTVYLYHRGKLHETTVNKVGRKYMYINGIYSRPIKFEHGSRYEVTNTVNSYKLYFSEKEYEEEQEGYTLHDRIRSHFCHSYKDATTLEDLRAIAAIIDKY